MGDTAAPTASPITTAAPTLAPTVTVDHLGIFVRSDAALGIAFVCAFLAICVGGLNIFRHLVHYTEPKLQKNIIRILFMVPFYALFSFLSLSSPKGELVFDSIRDIYEAFVVYCFLNLMLSYRGGENACLSVIMQDPASISHVFPLNCCLPSIGLNARFLRTCKQGTLQFVIIKPVMAIINIVFVVTDKEDNRGWEITQAIVYNISYTLALYVLVLFYKATHHHPGLRGQYPVLKFLSVKLVVFATYYQTVLVGIVPNVPSETLEAFNSFLLCCEMLIFALLQFWAFSWSEFAEGAAGKNGRIGQRSDSNFDSIGTTFDQMEQQSARTAYSDNDVALANAKNVISLQDVAKDAYYNFNNKYGEHVMLDSQAPTLEDDNDGRHASMDDRDPNANPFEQVSPGLSAGASESQLDVEVGEFGDVDFEPDQSPTPMFDPSLPSYDAKRDGELQQGDNPFAQDISNPLGLSEQGTSFRAEPSDGNDWNADFSEEFGAAPEPKKAKKKQKKKKKVGTDDGLDMINLA